MDFAAGRAHASESQRGSTTNAREPPEPETTGMKPTPKRFTAALVLALGATAPARADPADEALIDMTIYVHPAAERGSPAETAARVAQMLDEATAILEGVDDRSADELSCPVRFRAANVLRYDPAPAPPYPCGTGRPFEAALFPESVLFEASGCASPETPGLGMFVGSGFYRGIADAGATYAHEMGHVAGVPGNHLGWDGTLLAGGGQRTRRVPAQLCQVYLDYAQRTGAPHGTAACITGSALPPDPDAYSPEPRFAACHEQSGWCDGFGRCVEAPTACVDGHALPARGADCSSAGRCRACTGTLGDCIACDALLDVDPALPGLLLVESSAKGAHDVIDRSTPRRGAAALAELDRFLDFGAEIAGLARDPASGELYLAAREPGGGDRLYRVDADGAVAAIGPLAASDLLALTWASDERVLYGLFADPARPLTTSLRAIDPRTGAARGAPSRSRRA
jgi:hypothetical protein